jgi:hypothetical protein
MNDWPLIDHTFDGYHRKIVVMVSDVICIIQIDLASVLLGLMRPCGIELSLGKWTATAVPEQPCLHVGKLRNSKRIIIETLICASNTSCVVLSKLPDITIDVLYNPHMLRLFWKDCWCHHMIAHACIVTTKRTEHILTINSDQSWYTCPPLQQHELYLL